VGPAPAPAPAPVAAAPDAKTSYLPPATDPLVGQTLAGRYQIVKKLGEGGMGAVYLATHNVLEKQVALKLLHGEFARKPELVERFMQEAKAASRIRHENVIDISDFGSTPEGLVFFAMELLDGRDLHDAITRARLAGQLLPWSRSKKIFLQICSALSAAHARGIVHRDLKPENIYLVDFLGDGDFVKLLDFGIAKVTEIEGGGGGDRKLTKTGMLFGTPEYMSPEQARGEHVDHRVDIYAMGCILFQLVTGRVPFEAENFMGVLSQHLTEPAPGIPAAVFDRIGAPRELAGVIDQALAKDRAQRFQTIDELANAVRIVCGDPPVVPGTSGAIHAQSVPAPAETTQRATPVSLTPVPPTPSSPPATSTGRVRTLWTGNLSIPQVDEPGPPRPRSKLPLILGALVIAGGAAVGAVVVMRGGKGGVGEPAPVQGSAVVAAGSGSAVAEKALGAPVVTPPPTTTPTTTPPTTTEAPLPAKVTVTMDSKPRGAVVKDLASGVVYGATPKTFSLAPSHKPRAFSLTLRGYTPAVIELVPDQETLERVEVLVKGAGGTPAVKQAGSNATVQAAPPDAGVPAIKPPPPPPDDDCPELPCLKSDPTRKGSGGP